MEVANLSNFVNIPVSDLDKGFDMIHGSETIDALHPEISSSHSAKFYKEPSEDTIVLASSDANVWETSQPLRGLYIYKLGQKGHLVYEKRRS